MALQDGGQGGITACLLAGTQGRLLDKEAAMASLRSSSGDSSSDLDLPAPPQLPPHGLGSKADMLECDGKPQPNKAALQAGDVGSGTNEQTIHTGRWTQEEHQAFLVGLQLYGREWKKVAQQIKTRSSAQIRSHAQKYFAKLSKAELEGRSASDHEWLQRCVESTLHALRERKRTLLEQAETNGTAAARMSSDEEGGASDTGAGSEGEKEARLFVPALPRQTSAASAHLHAHDGGAADMDVEQADTAQHLRARRAARFAEDQGSGGSDGSSWSMHSNGSSASSASSNGDPPGPPHLHPYQHTHQHPPPPLPPPPLPTSKSSPTLSIESLDDGELVALQVLCGTSEPPVLPDAAAHRHRRCRDDGAPAPAPTTEHADPAHDAKRRKVAGEDGGVRAAGEDLGMEAATSPAATAPATTPGRAGGAPPVLEQQRRDAPVLSSGP